ncbi:hypothetical protein TWF481_011474 [Arthrobotrys musiformis]|uniref:DUF676 domain-containing protein n=1 Tax=Arthrobotrys musiformis TaxID=47236 RepID=A0AAV9VYI9_9PEZI
MSSTVAQKPKRVRPLTFRIQHINQNRTNEEVKDCMEKALANDGKEAKDISIELTFASDTKDSSRRVCCVTFHNKSKNAAATSQPAPPHPSLFDQLNYLLPTDHLMVDLRTGEEWESSYDYGSEVDEESEFMVTIDKGFRGLTPLYEPTDPKTVKANVIAVMGLTPHPYGVWQGERKDHMWLRHSFKHSEGLKDCRSLIFGYNGDLWVEALYKKEDFVNDLIDTFTKFTALHPNVTQAPLFQVLQAMTNRYPHTQEPIIFVGHSYGGLLITDLLRKSFSRHNDAQAYRVYQVTRGIFFFGTPHRGMFIDDLTKIIKDRRTLEITEQLEQKDLYYEGIFTEDQKDFIRVVREGDIKIYSFVEKELTNKLHMPEGGSSPIQSTERKEQVSSASASLSIFGLEKEHRANGKNHRNIVKFDSRYDETFKATEDFMVDCLKSMKEVEPLAGHGIAATPQAAALSE